MNSSLALALYAALKTDIQNLSGDDIGAAVAEYLDEHPTTIADSLDLQLDDGLLCVIMPD